jgi:hypothetical protein
MQSGSETAGAKAIKRAESIRKKKLLIGANNIPSSHTRNTVLTNNSSKRIRPATIHSSSIQGRISMT